MIILSFWCDFIGISAAFHSLLLSMSEFIFSYGHLYIEFLFLFWLAGHLTGSLHFQLAECGPFYEWDFKLLFLIVLVSWTRNISISSFFRIVLNSSSFDSRNSILIYRILSFENLVFQTIHLYSLLLVATSWHPRQLQFFLSLLLSCYNFSAYEFDFSRYVHDISLELLEDLQESVVVGTKQVLCSSLAWPRLLSPKYLAHCRSRFACTGRFVEEFLTGLTLNGSVFLWNLVELVVLQLPGFGLSLHLALLFFWVTCSGTQIIFNLNFVWYIPRTCLYCSKEHFLDLLFVVYHRSRITLWCLFFNTHTS